jgi:hypothetical protein
MNRSERPNHPLGGTTVGGLRMYLTGPDSWGSWQVNRPTGWDLLNYLKADIYKLEKRPWMNFTGTFSRISER